MLNASWDCAVLLLAQFPHCQLHYHYSPRWGTCDSIRVPQPRPPGDESWTSTAGSSVFGVCKPLRGYVRAIGAGRWFMVTGVARLRTGGAPLIKQCQGHVRWPTESRCIWTGGNTCRLLSSPADASTLGANTLARTSQTWGLSFTSGFHSQISLTLPILLDNCPV